MLATLTNVGRGLSKDKLSILNQTFVNCMPELTFWLDAPIEWGCRVRASVESRIVLNKKNDFFSRVRAGYEELSLQYPERVKRLDATQAPDRVFEAALEHLEARI